MFDKADHEYCSGDGAATGGTDRTTGRATRPAMVGVVGGKRTDCGSSFVGARPFTALVAGAGRTAARALDANWKKSKGLKAPPSRAGAVNPDASKDGGRKAACPIVDIGMER